MKSATAAPPATDWGPEDPRCLAMAAQIEELEAYLARGEFVERARKVQIKGAWAGTAQVVLARLGVIDRQGDIILPGCLLNEPADRVPVSAWNHSYLRDPEAPAVGRARVWEVDDELRGEIAWDPTDEGRAAAQRVKDSRPDWSWGLAQIETRPLTAAEVEAGATRAIAKVRVIEVSPVDQGASISSGTVAACLGGSCPFGSAKLGGALGPEYRCQFLEEVVLPRLETVMEGLSARAAEPKTGPSPQCAGCARCPRTRGPALGDDGLVAEWNRAARVVEARQAAAIRPRPGTRAAEVLAHWRRGKIIEDIEDRQREQILAGLEYRYRASVIADLEATIAAREAA